MPATRDKNFRRARKGIVRVVGASSVINASRAALMRGLLLACVLLLGGCGASDPSKGSPTAATAPESNARPATTQRAGDVPVTAPPTPAATGAENSSGVATKGVSNAVTPATLPTATGAQDDAAASAAYEGFYEVLGARPKGFEQFGNFMIRAPQDGRISGAVVPLAGEVHEFARATLADRKLTFVTQKVGGISYSFEGVFLERPPFAGKRKAAVAEGLVRKFRNDQPAGEASMKFYFDEGGEDP